MITFLSQQLAYRSYRSVLKLMNKISINRIPTEYYFGYGANLSVERFKKNQMMAVEIGTAVLKDYRLGFGLQTQFKGLGYASVCESSGGQVWGRLYKIDLLSLWLLDIMEFVPFGAYKRVQLPVECDGETIIANVYVAHNHRTDLKPSKRYLDLIIAGSKASGFPEDYIENLSKQAVVEKLEIDHEFTRFTKDKKRKYISKLWPVYKKHDILREKLLEYLRNLDAKK